MKTDCEEQPVFYCFLENDCISILKRSLFFATMKTMESLYDVQQLLKRFGIIVYMGKRLYDIELMKIELKAIYDNGLISQEDYMLADLVLRREHRLELERQDQS